MLKIYISAILAVFVFGFSALGIRECRKRQEYRQKLKENTEHYDTTRTAEQQEAKDFIDAQKDEQRKNREAVRDKTSEDVVELTPEEKQKQMKEKMRKIKLEF